MTDSIYPLLIALLDGEPNAQAVLADYLEETGNPKAGEVRAADGIDESDLTVLVLELLPEKNRKECLVDIENHSPLVAGTERQDNPIDVIADTLNAVEFDVFVSFHRRIYTIPEYDHAKKEAVQKERDWQLARVREVLEEMCVLTLEKS